ncbi:MAG: isocitrate/isopropylmalate dehydrogenase family protein, partial [Alphaproteobacteria bacterium]
MGRNTEFRIAVIPGDGIGVEVTEAAFAVAEAAVARVGGFSLRQKRLDAGAAYYAETGKDVAPGVFEAAEAADAIFLGAIGLPSVRYPDGTEISP